MPMVSHWVRDKMDAIFKCIFVNEDVWIPINISLKFVPKGPINNIPALVQIMAWLRPGHKPLFEPWVGCLPTHICVTWPQWVHRLACVVSESVITINRLDNKSLNIPNIFQGIVLAAIIHQHPLSHVSFLICIDNKHELLCTWRIY